MSKVKHYTLLSMLLAMAIIVGYLESFIPVIIPGVKLGLANVIILVCLIHFKWYEALIVSILRIFIVSLLIGTFLNITFLMSLSGGILSFLAMFIALKCLKNAVIFPSLLGSLFHVIGQILIAIIITSTINVIYYLPIILLLAIPTGILVGILAKAILKIKIFNYETDVSK